MHDHRRGGLCLQRSGSPPCCLYSLLSQTRPPDEILVINNASTDATGTVARAVPRVRVLDEPVKGLVVARETGRCAAQGEVVAYIDADCRVPIFWMERVEAHLRRAANTVGLTGPYRFYDWDWSGRALIRLYVRNFWSEIVRHRPADSEHLDVRA